MFVCTLTQQPTNHPVLSTKSRKIFDYNAIKSYIETCSKDPITDDVLTLEDLIDLSDAVTIPNSDLISKPEYSSIPTMLSGFQAAWDSLSLELFQLRNQLDKTKKELSLALYKYDAAVNVAVNASKERDEAKSALARLIVSQDVDEDIGQAVEQEDVGDEVSRHDEDVEMHENMENDAQNWEVFVSALKTEQGLLLSQHKKENKARKSIQPSYPLDKDVTIDLLDIELDVGKENNDIQFENNIKNDESVVAFGNGFKLINVADLECVSELPESSTKLSCWIQNEPFVLLQDEEGYSLVDLRTKRLQKLSTDLRNITTMAAHPSLNIFILCNQDEFEVFKDFKSVFLQEWNSKINKIRFHNDGVFVALSYSNNSNIDIYDLTDRSIKLSIQQPESKECIDFKFASNGYNLVVGYENRLGVFDMRRNNFASLLETKATLSPVVLLDDLGLLAVYGDGYTTYDKKKKVWTPIKLIPGSLKVVDIAENGHVLVLEDSKLVKAVLN